MMLSGCNYECKRSRKDEPFQPTGVPKTIWRWGATTFGVEFASSSTTFCFAMSAGDFNQCWNRETASVALILLWQINLCATA